MAKPAALLLVFASFCAVAAPPDRFSLVRSDSGDSADGDVLFSLDESAIRLSCAEEAARRPEEGPPAIAVLCHGLGGRKESALFDALSKAIRGRGIGVVRFDFNGHGESEGDFSHMTVSNEVLDVETVVDYCRNVRNARVALVGHSQGGVVAALAASRLGADSVEALALLAPAAVLREDAQRGRILDAAFDPLDPPAAIPLMDGRLLLGRDYVLDAQRTDPYAAIAAYGGPLVVVHGQGDTVVPWSCGQRFVDDHPGRGDLVLLRSAGHDFKGWEDSVAGTVADFLAEGFGYAEVVPAEEPHAEDAEAVPVVAAPAEEDHAESAEVAEPVLEVAVPTEEDHAESAEVAEPGPAIAAPAEEDHAESAEVAEPGPADSGEGASEPAAEEPPPQSVPVELPPDIRGDMQSFLLALDTQTSAEEETPAEAEEVAEPVLDLEEPAPAIEEPPPAEEPPAEAEEVAEPVLDLEEPAPAEEPLAEAMEIVEPALVEGGSGEAEPPPVEPPAEAEEVAEPVLDLEEPAPAIEEPAAVEEPPAEVEEVAEPVLDLEEPAPAEEPLAEAMEIVEPAPVEGGSGEAEPPPVEPPAEAEEVAEPVLDIEEPAPAEEPPAAEVPELVLDIEEPAPAIEEPAAVEEPPAEVEEVAESVLDIEEPAPAEEPHAEPAEAAEGGEAAITESTPAAEPPTVDSPQVPAAEPPAVDSPQSVDSIQSLAAAYPSLPILPNGSVINILAAPNGFTWQGLEVQEEDLFERLRIFGASIPDAYVRIQAFPETPFERVKTLAATAKEAGFSRISVVLPSAR